MNLSDSPVRDPPNPFQPFFELNLEYKPSMLLCRRFNIAGSVARPAMAYFFSDHVDGPAPTLCFTKDFEGFQSSVRFPRWPPAGPLISCGAPVGTLCFPKVFEGSRPVPWRPGACFFYHVDGPAPTWPKPFVFPMILKGFNLP